jgi:hypothetical protein
MERKIQKIMGFSLILLKGGSDFFLLLKNKSFQSVYHENTTCPNIHSP